MLPKHQKARGGPIDRTLPSEIAGSIVIGCIGSGRRIVVGRIHFVGDEFDCVVKHDHVSTAKVITSGRPNALSFSVGCCLVRTRSAVGPDNRVETSEASATVEPAHPSKRKAGDCSGITSRSNTRRTILDRNACNRRAGVATMGSKMLIPWTAGSFICTFVWGADWEGEAISPNMMVFDVPSVQEASNCCWAIENMPRVFS